MVEKKFYDAELKGYFDESGISKRIELQREKSGEYIFGVSGEQMDSNRKSGIEELDFEDSGIMAVIRYQVEYSEMKNLMYDMLEEYLNGIAWVPYDEGKRKEICREAFERLNEYIPVNIG